MATRASLSISEPNEKWIQARIDSKEFSSRSEVVNDLIRRAREVESIRARLIASEEAIRMRGHVTESPAELLAAIRKKAAADGAV